MIVSASYDVVEASADYSVHDGDVVYTVDGGPVGPAGPQGPTGPPGPGVPTGGSTGDVATKASNADFDIAWQTPAPADRITSGGNELVIDADTILGTLTSSDGGEGLIIFAPGQSDAGLILHPEMGVGIGLEDQGAGRMRLFWAGDGYVSLRGSGSGDNVEFDVSKAGGGIRLSIDGEARHLVVGSVGDNPWAPDGSLLLDEVAGPHWRKDGAWIPIGARQSPDGTWWDMAVDNSGNVSAVAL